MDIQDLVNERIIEAIEDLRVDDEWIDKLIDAAEGEASLNDIYVAITNVTNNIQDVW